MLTKVHADNIPPWHLLRFKINLIDYEKKGNINENNILDLVNECFISFVPPLPAW